MNIAIFTNNYLPNPYGVANSIGSFRRSFEKEGHQVYILAPFAKGYIDENPNVFRYPAIDLKYKISFPLPIPYSLKISQMLKNLDLDVIHSQHPNLLGRVAMKWARQKNIPLVFTWHTLYDQYTNFVPLIPDKLAARWIIKKATGYANKADQIIVPTKSIKEIIQNWGVENKNIAVVPTGVEERIYQNPNGNRIRNKYKIRDNEILLLLVSRLTEEKNIIFLFYAVAKMLKMKNNIKFLVVGEGYLERELKKMVSKNNLKNKIIFAGLVERKDIKNYYTAGDIFVCASLSETQGMTISEAMYGGLPIIAVKAAGAKDLVEENINGFLVENNEDEFAEALGKLIKNEDLRKKFGRESKRIAREKYTDAVCAGKMLKIYADLIVMGKK